MRINRKNTRPLMKHRWPRTVIFLLTLVMSCAAVGKENQEKLLRTLKNQIDEYLRKVEFKCTYTYSEYLVDSKEEAESFDTSNGRLIVRATGSLIKSKTMTLESFVLDHAIPEMGLTPAANNHVTVTNSDLRAHYVMAGENAPHRSILVMEEEKTEGGIQLLDQGHTLIICPLTYGGGRTFMNCLESFAHIQKTSLDRVSFNISHDEENIVISQHADFSAEGTDTVLVLSNEYRYPILLREDRKGHNHAVDADIFNTVRAFDLVNVGKGLVVPKKVCSSIGPFWTDVLGEGTKGKFLIYEWESEDLGKEPPKAEDFLIPLDRDTDFTGLDLELVYKLEHNVPQYFDINSFTLADLFYNTESNAAAPKAKAPKYYRPALIVLGALIVSAGIYRKWRNRGRRHADQS